MKKILISLSMFILLFLITISIFWNVNYIDESIIEGEMYGFVVGEKKEISFNKIINNKDIDNIKAVQIGSTPNDFLIIDIDKIEFDKLRNHVTWLLLLNDKESFLDTIRLDFDKDKLQRIYRHKQWFESP